jgi:5-methyltetrahydropteroyltriglutamate--homocysteine methyltransferase
MATQILTTTVGSYPVPDWLAALPSEAAVLDATRVVFNLQRQAGIDLPTDGELYRFDVNHPDTNGMIEYFIGPMEGIRMKLGRSDYEAAGSDGLPAQAGWRGGRAARGRRAESVRRLRKGG